MWFGGLWLIGLLVVGVLAGRALVTAVMADGWQQSTGRIVRSELSQRKSKRSTYFVAVIEFAYDAGGVKRTSTGLSAFDGWSRKGNPNELVARFPLGADVPVAVNPDDPSEAYLQTGFRWAYAATVVASLPAVAVLGMALAGVLRQLPAGARVVGPFVAFDQPLPRLVLLKSSAVQMGMIWAAIAGGIGVLAMFEMGSFTPEWNGRTTIPPGLNPGAGDLPWILIAMPAAAAAAAGAGWFWRRRQEASFKHEVVIDAANDLMVLAKPVFGVRPTLALLTVTRIETRKVVTRTGKKRITRYDVRLQRTEGPSERVARCKSSMHADEVVRWLTETMQAGGYQLRDHDFVDYD